MPSLYLTYLRDGWWEHTYITCILYIHKYEIKGTFREICTFPPQQRDDNKTCLSPACKTLRKEKLQHRTSSVTSVCHASSLTTCSCAGKSPAFSETSPRMSKTCCVHTIKLSIIISNVSKQVNYHQLQVLYDLNLSYNPASHNPSGIALASLAAAFSYICSLKSLRACPR